MSPYIVTVLKPCPEGHTEPVMQCDGCGWDGVAYHTPRCKTCSDMCEVIASRRAVATLEEAREATACIVLGVNAPNEGLRSHAARQLHPDARQVVWLELKSAIAHLPEAGGTVGPLPDGTVIEVEATTWHAIAVAVNFLGRGYVTEAEWPELIAAYNARQEDAPSRINVEDTGYRGGGLMGRREAKP